jgi:hypothetical protein
MYMIPFPIAMRARVMVFNATLNNISAILWRSVILVGETGLPGEKHRPVINNDMT